MSTKKDKGVNVNYLLNFNYESAANARESAPRHQPFRRNLPKQSTQPFQKERFVQANYRFIVSNIDSDYSANFRDPDLLVEWDKIEQVCFYNQNESSCPICLDHPVAAKISKCGHIFCWVCVLRHLSFSQGNKQIGKCPICFAYISIKELKSCIIEPVKNFGVGDIIQFTLLKRSKESVVPLPIKQWRSKTERCPMASDLNTVFSRLAIASAQDISDIIRREDTELQEQAKAAMSEQDESLPFILQAQEYLAERLSKMEMLLKLTDSSSSTDSGLRQSVTLSDSATKQQTQNSDNNTNSQPFDAWNSSFQSDPSAISENPSDAQPAPPVSKPPAQEQQVEAQQKAPSIDFSETADFYYIYQASSGQQAILHPLDIKVLLNEFGSFEQCPETIEGKIMEIESEFQSEKMRKKFKFIGHLPLNTSFEFVEIDLRKIVSKEAFRPYQDEIQKRIRKRQKILKQHQLEKQKEEAMIKRKVQSVINKTDFPSVAPTSEDVAKEPPQEQPQTSSLEEVSTPKSTKQTVWGQPAPETKSTPFLDALKSHKSPPLVTSNTPSKNTKSGKQYIVFSTTSSRSYK
mmetsp:Transcript_5743/g.8033  ORF Transcript_5743/g.8033 Transcript_5743/m.8033 type:complete len:575 (+) Transcript_5743:139-1863(+)